MDKLTSKKMADMDAAFEHIEKGTPEYKPVVRAFREIFISRAALKGRISLEEGGIIEPPDAARLSEGFPWLSGEKLASFVEPWGENTKSVLQSLIMAFPGIAADVTRLMQTFDNGDNPDLLACISALVEGREDELARIACGLGIAPLTLKFVLGQLLKPFVEKRTETLSQQVQDIVWNRGYCPVCGAFPEISFIKNKEGQRWLKCSLCEHEWQYDRMLCPYCGERNEHKQLIGVSDNNNEWIEVCSGCNRYIVAIDLRNQADTVKEVAAVGMIHLDLLAQNKGFIPVAECAWNLFIPNKSTPICC